MGMKASLVMRPNSILRAPHDIWLWSAQQSGSSFVNGQTMTLASGTHVFTTATCINFQLKDFNSFYKN